MSNKGFTLIETLVAITILLIAVLGPMSVISKFYADNNYSRHQIAASFLAQDALETASNIVSNSRLQQFRKIGEEEAECDDTRQWLENLNDCVGNDCNADSLKASVCSSGQSCYKICYDIANDLYRPCSEVLASNTEDTVFTRTMKIEEKEYTGSVSGFGGYDGTDIREAKVKVKVSWKQRGFSRDPFYEVSTLLTEAVCQ